MRIDGFEVWPVSVRRELHAIGEARREIMHERIRGLRIALPDLPRQHQLAIRALPDPRPQVTRQGWHAVEEPVRACARAAIRGRSGRRPHDRLFAG